MANLFERLGQQRQLAENLEKERQAETIPRGPLLQPVVPPAAPQSSPTEKMLDWLVNRWPQPAVRVRDICRFGPGSIRDQKSATATAEILVERGWLTPLETRQHNMKMWQIVRGPSAPRGS
jgi:hypothetical protein